MSETEFFYWLQGFFELAQIGDAGTPWFVTVNQKRAECIQRHAALVRETGGGVGVPPGRQFANCELLADLMADPALATEARDLLARKMGECVASQFENAIDPRAGGDEKRRTLQRTHDGSQGSGRTIMC